MNRSQALSAGSTKRGATGQRYIYVKGNRYQVTIRQFKKNVQVGSFATLDEALAARNKWFEDHRAKHVAK